MFANLIHLFSKAVARWLGSLLRAIRQFFEGALMLRNRVRKNPELIRNLIWPPIDNTVKLNELHYKTPIPGAALALFHFACLSNHPSDLDT
jgi:hypothetical protein